MPSINRIRVNNIKYNFGTQQYDDFSMRMYGKNTLYDLANGGGKSILMLLLLQNLIPNCTLDDKQPVEKLFRAGCGNTTIHSLIEWKLDECYVNEGYRYMTTGFCARKAPGEQLEPGSSRETAVIEYFNYCIFYREYNRNDIVNLPLSEGNERITYTGLRNYLKDLAKKDMGLEIRIFDKKGEYQRFISQYGLYESHWEIIRGINKTEGHVRTYFETNYKTTRKVVEDLLIEEIIEKAFLTKTGRDAGDDNMAETLLDIKDKLALLAKKKRDIADYDHQIELINVLESKVNSCMGQYESHDKVSSDLADVYISSRTFAENDDQHMKELTASKEQCHADMEAQKKRLMGLKVDKDQQELSVINREIEAINQEIDQREAEIANIKRTISYKESINDYINYLKDKQTLEETRLIIENIQKNVSVGDARMQVYAYNRKLRDDAKLKELLVAKEEGEKEKDTAFTELEYCNKLIKEGEISGAVHKNNIKAYQQNMKELNSRLAGLTEKVSILVPLDAEKMYDEAVKARQAVTKEAASLKADIDEAGGRLYDSKYKHSMLEAEIEQLSENQRSIKADAVRYREAGSRIKSIMTVYGVDKPQELAAAIDKRITDAFVDSIKKQQEIEKLKEKRRFLAQGRRIAPTEGVNNVINYISTRHGSMAMFGGDYISALPEETRRELIAANPALPFGVVVKAFSEIADDINLDSIDTGNECVMIYDMDGLNLPGCHLSDNMIMACRNSDFFCSDEELEKLRAAIESEINNQKEEIMLTAEKLDTYREDYNFVSHLTESRYIEAEAHEREIDKQLMDKKDEAKALKGLIKELEGNISRNSQKYEELTQKAEALGNELSLFYQIDEINTRLSEDEEKLGTAQNALKDIEKKVEQLKSEEMKWDTNVRETTARLEAIAHAIEDISFKWTTYYADYYDKTSAKEILTIDDDRLDAEFMAMRAVAAEHAPDIEDKKKLAEALSTSMKRIARTIEKRGIRMSELEQEAQLYVTDEEALRVLDEELSRLTLVSATLQEKKNNSSAAAGRLEGSINYAIRDMERIYGAGSYIKEDIPSHELEHAILNGDRVLGELTARYNDSVDRYNEYYKQQGFMMDLYKDVKRIIDTNDIDTGRARVLPCGKDELRQLFEDSLLKFDRSRKNLDKAKNELIKFKGQTAEALTEMGVYEMAATIRNDVIIPDNYYDAKNLLSGLLQIVDYIKLEKERVEKGIEDMVAIKDNFEDQCIQRCMDVKTELEKLPKLSRITAGDEIIKMVDLTIPYVKEEFLKQRMSDYIDDIVKGADAFDDERKRIKYIRECLGLKKLFGVVVTDMNGIKLNLYKRERIREQSRYLRYEEAVGSTGQSQGIYIQFLVAIINYIAGMYSYGVADDVTTKTIFIDNPFGAAKDIYIWEPIFAMLAANNVQLIVPARGATPAITGRFDVNYILGQQLVGGRQQTVVIDYTSKTNQEELEYHELSYEQASFDFI